MPFQYRIMRQGVKQLERYGQLDLYFFKPKLSGVGVKVRFSSGEGEMWHTDELQVKYIKNTQDISSNFTLFENWKKLQIPIKLTLFSKNYILKHPQEFSMSQERSIDKVISEQLQKINRTICEAILSQKIGKKEFDKNEDLKRWVSEDNPLVDIIAIQKSRFKGSKFQRGDLKMYGLYGPNNETFWSTVCFESKLQEQVRQKVKEYGEVVEQNTSYPKLIDKYYYK